ncbi:hypothetical protein [Blastococcus sp. PRF04-17]|uniref:hypothetical protein n=1 Tax=Blastococcus sp. PRF04-17 TaxID=2933797 RepID=UPI001FF135FD|nr:hypothetical protein [Blastococcus sp. PRF04-17]UOY01641.1 hypothetical protein MVA48_22430 [Blastococcus sp. PRF04-17]
MTAVAQDGLFDVVAEPGALADRQANCQRLRDQLLGEVSHCERELHRLGALAYAVAELAGERPAAAVATRLAEHSWVGTGEQLVLAARGIVAQRRSS